MSKIFLQSIFNPFSNKFNKLISDVDDTKPIFIDCSLNSLINLFIPGLTSIFDSVKKSSYISFFVLWIESIYLDKFL